jgi:glycosyltransferase involved in cell wall biosynthesis
LESVAAQFTAADEVIFLDNASSDRSADFAEQLGDELSLDLSILRNERPAPISVNLNQLLKKANGEVVAVLSTDDWYAPGYVGAMKKAASLDQDAAWFYPGGFHYLEDQGTTLPIDERGFAEGDVSGAMRKGEAPFLFVGCCYRRSVLEAVGGWDETQLIEDKDLFFRLACRYNVRRVPERLVYYRRSSASASSNTQFLSSGLAAFIKKHRAELIDPKHQLSEIYRSNAAVSIDQRRFGMGLRMITKALFHWPTNPQTPRTIAYLMRSIVS